MKTSFVNFWRKILGCARLAIIAQLEYRINLLTDALFQPVITSGIEITLWSAIFIGTGRTMMAGYPRESYLAYALWAAFFARISVNWMYEFRMIEEIESGSVNSVLSRPISFYEYYLGQFMGYKLLTSLLSFVAPLAIMVFWPSAGHLERIPLAFLLSVYYLILVHTISFTVASFAFYFNRVYSFTAAKNLVLALITGELFPLDLIPEPFRHWIILLPFSNAVYIPVGYITGRLPLAAIAQGAASCTIGLLIFGVLAHFCWLGGRRAYSGTGA